MYPRNQVCHSFLRWKKRCFKDNECPRHTLLLAKPARRRFFVSNGAILVHNVVFRSRNSTRFSPEIPLSQQFVPDQILWQVHRITLARNVANPASCGKKYMLDDPRPFSAASGVPKSNFKQKKCTMLKCCQEVASFTWLSFLTYFVFALIPWPGIETASPLESRHSYDKWSP